MNDTIQVWTKVGLVIRIVTLIKECKQKKKIVTLELEGHKEREREGRGEGLK